MGEANLGLGVGLVMSCDDRGDGREAFVVLRCAAKRAAGERCCCPTCRPDGWAPFVFTATGASDSVAFEDAADLPPDEPHPTTGESLVRVCFAMNPHDDRIMVEATCVTATDTGAAARGVIHLEYALPGEALRPSLDCDYARHLGGVDR